MKAGVIAITYHSLAGDIKLDNATSRHARPRHATPTAPTSNNRYICYSRITFEISLSRIFDFVISVSMGIVKVVRFTPTYVTWCKSYI